MTAPAVLLLPAGEAGAEQSVCAVDGGVLTYIRGAWRHLADSGQACDAPEPDRCPHGCGEPVAVDVRCAHTGGPCDDCCWTPRHRTGAWQ